MTEKLLISPTFSSLLRICFLALFIPALASGEEERVIEQIKSKLPTLEKQADLIIKMLERDKHKQKFLADIKKQESLDSRLENNSSTYLYKVLKKLGHPLEETFIQVQDGCLNPFSFTFTGDYLLTNGISAEEFIESPTFRPELDDLVKTLLQLQIRIQRAAKQHIAEQIECTKLGVPLYRDTVAFKDERRTECKDLGSFEVNYFDTPHLLYDLFCEQEIGSSKGIPVPAILHLLVNDESRIYDLEPEYLRTLKYWVEQLDLNGIKFAGRNVADYSLFLRLNLEKLEKSIASGNIDPAIRKVKREMAAINVSIEAKDYAAATNKLRRIRDDQSISQLYRNWAKQRQVRVDRLWSASFGGDQRSTIARTFCSTLGEEQNAPDIEYYCICLSRAVIQHNAEVSNLLSVATKVQVPPNPPSWTEKERLLLLLLTKECEP